MFRPSHSTFSETLKHFRPTRYFDWEFPRTSSPRHLFHHLFILVFQYIFRPSNIVSTRLTFYKQSSLNRISRAFSVFSPSYDPHFFCDVLTRDITLQTVLDNIFRGELCTIVEKQYKNVNYAKQLVTGFVWKRRLPNICPQMRRGHCEPNYQVPRNVPRVHLECFGKNYGN